nr:maestro heat-like repeat-containing protein family member 7 [Columba livia]
MVLVFIEAMRDASSFDKEAARNALGMVMGHPELWLADVPKITTCIHQNLECINMDSARQSMESLLLLMAEENPGEVVRTLLKIAPPGDSTALDMWEAMFSVPQTLHNVLRELHIQLQDRRYRVLSTPLEDISILRLALLASSDLEEEEFAPMYLAGRFLRQRRPAMLSLVLSGIMTLSEKEEMARKMLVLLPDLRRVLFFGYKAVTMKALVVFRHLLAQLEREKASPIAVQLAEFVLPFFDDELSQMRESSISLFRDLMKMVVENHKRQMKSIAQASLLPLFFHMSDQVRSVAKAAQEALIAAAELLKRKQLQHLAQTQQTWRTGEYLLKQDRRRAKEFLNRSRPYLKNEQASLREAAVRFIGLAARHLRDASEVELAEICSALQPLETDSEPSLCCLAAQTIAILSSSRKQPRSRWSLRALCCWRS